MIQISTSCRNAAVLMLVAASLMPGCRKAKSDRVDTDTDADTDTNADGDTDTDSDTHTDPPVDSGEDSGSGLQEIIEACVAKYSSCGPCNGNCEGGAGQSWWYPLGEGESSTDVSVDEILQTAIASTYCSVCDPCGASYVIKEGDISRAATALEFCTVIAEYNENCSGCVARYEEIYV